jgi:hypothetical protein
VHGFVLHQAGVDLLELFGPVMDPGDRQLLGLTA